MLIAEKDIQSKQLEGLLVKFEQMKEINEIYAKRIDTFEQAIVQPEIKLESMKNEEIDDNDKKIPVKNEVLNDLSNNFINESEVLVPKESANVSSLNGKIDDEKENLALICEQNSNGEIENESDQVHQNDNLKINTELIKLNNEIEELKQKLETEINSNFKLKDELNLLKGMIEKMLNY